MNFKKITVYFNQLILDTVYKNYTYCALHVKMISGKSVITIRIMNKVYNEQSVQIVLLFL